MTEKTRSEIEALKANWLSDPCWDIETTEGFEAHHDELLAFRKQTEAPHIQRWQQENTFAEFIGKPDPAFGLDKAQTLVYKYQEDGKFQSYVYVGFADHEVYTTVYRVYILTEKVAAGEETDFDREKLAWMQRLADRLRAAQPDLTISAPVFVHGDDHAVTFTVQRVLTEADLTRGQYFRLEAYSGGGAREQAAFERRVSQQIALGFAVAGVQSDGKDGAVTVALVR